MCDDQTKSVEDAVGVASKRVSEPTVRLLKDCCFIICLGGPGFKQKKKPY